MTIPQMEPWLGEEEAAAVNDYMRSGGWLMEHDKTRKFESIIAELYRSVTLHRNRQRHRQSNAGGARLRVGPGDEVIVPNYTMIATANSVFMLGANPVFVDVEPETLCLDIDRTEAALTPKTRAIMLVTANGRYPRAGIEAFVDLADKHGLALIEDAAQSLGSHYPDGRHIGASAKSAAFHSPCQKSSQPDRADA